MSSKQAPIHSGFGPTTTARETLHRIDLRGKVAIVTGGYSGIGLETTRALAEAGTATEFPANIRIASVSPKARACFSASSNYHARKAKLSRSSKSD